MADDIMDLVDDLIDQFDECGIDIGPTSLLDCLSSCGLTLTRAKDDSVQKAYFAQVVENFANRGVPHD